jgi:ATP-dependent Lon protease
MIIEYTKIPNVVPETISESKQVLAENIIQNVYPLFDEVYKSKVDTIERVKDKLKAKKEEVSQQKTDLQGLMYAYKRQKKIAKLLDRIEKLITSGLVYDGALKHETTILLKIATKLENDKLDYHLRQTLQTINKRFSR